MSVVLRLLHLLQFHEKKQLLTKLSGSRLSWELDSKGRNENQGARGAGCGAPTRNLWTCSLVLSPSRRLTRVRAPLLMALAVMYCI